jgi:hypothetical protein
VRKSGRVRVHKSKENPNGTFSIGKTWFLDDLTAIESFTSPTTSPNNQQWAGDVGFVVTIGKPYYWQAQTDKEKKFFIASLIKIYNKYTGGRNPTLTGFEQRELEQVLGGAQVPRRQDRPPPRPSPLDTAPNSANASVSSGYNAPLSAQTTTAPGFPERMASRSPLVPNGKSSPAQSIDTGRPSQDHQSLRRLASSNKSQDSVAASIARSEDASSLRPSTRNGVNGTSPYATPEPTPLPPSEEKPPERKRPPMDPLRPLQVDKNLIPAPLMSPGMRREPTVPPRSVERISTRKDSVSRRNEPALRAEQVTTPKDTSRPDMSGRSPSPAISTPPSAPPTSAIPPIPTPPPVDNTPPVPEPEEETKPGLKSMINKKSKGDIAGAFWKAANAASAFKPRPGGAAERLRQIQNKTSDGPDGITSVIPAPPKPVPVQKPPEPAAPVVEPPPKTADRSAVPSIPEVKITESDSAITPSSAQPSVKDLKEKKAEEPPPVEEPRRSIVAGNDIKYLATLGIDPSLLDNRTNEFAKWLDYFGWVPGEKMRARNFDEMRTDLDRELSKAQAGGWLARFQEEDERVEAIKRGIDLSISECDELDNLLTLYSVELSVSLVVSDSWSGSDRHRRSRMISRTLRRRAKASRCKPPTRSCSGKNSSHCWRRVLLASPTLTLSRWRRLRLRLASKKSKPRSSRCSRP